MFVLDWQLRVLSAYLVGVLVSYLVVRRLWLSVYYSFASAGKEFLAFLWGSHVLVRSDNATNVYHINHQGGTRSAELMKASQSLLTWADPHLSNLRTMYLPGVRTPVCRFPLTSGYSAREVVSTYRTMTYNSLEKVHTLLLSLTILLISFTSKAEQCLTEITCDPGHKYRQA